MTHAHSPAGNGWYAADLSTGSVPWRISLPAEVSAELESAMDMGAIPRLDDPPPDGLRHTADFAATVTDRLSNGPGIVMITGFSGEDEDHARSLLWSFGRVMGQPVPQNRNGDLITRVEDRGGDLPKSSHQSYQGHHINNSLAFHVDRTDIIALHCVHNAPAGGLSQVVSSATLHDLLLEENPDLLEELHKPLPHDSQGNNAPGEEPWYEMPVFAEIDGRLVVHYVRRFIDASQQHPTAPRLSERQKRALDAVDEILTRQEIILSVDFQPGDLQLINNFSALHARTAFTSRPEGPGRLLYRLWLSTSWSPRLPASYARHYGSVLPGVVRGGTWPSDLSGAVGMPVTAGV